MMIKLRATLALLFIFTHIVGVWAQTMNDDERTVVISGTITDDEHQPLEIASVKVEGQMIGTVSDLEGKYSLTVQSADTVTITFSMIGYETRKRTGFLLEKI